MGRAIYAETAAIRVAATSSVTDTPNLLHTAPYSPLQPLRNLAFAVEGIAFGCVPPSIIAPGFLACQTFWPCEHCKKAVTLY